MNNQTDIIRKIAEEYILDRDGKVMIGAAGVYRDSFRGITFYAVDSLDSDEVTASIDPHKAIIKAMRLANVGAGKAAASTAINAAKVVGSTALQAASLATSVVGLAAKLAGTAAGGLASVANGTGYRAGVSLAQAAAPVVEKVRVQKAKMMSQHEAALTVFGAVSVRIEGPFGLALVEKVQDRHGDLYMVVGPSEVDRCRESGAAVETALTMVGLNIGSQLRETGRDLAASSAAIASQAGRLTGSLLGGLATGLLKASDTMNGKRRF